MLMKMGLKYKTKNYKREFSTAPKQTFTIDRVFHWLSALSIIYFLLSMGAEIHNVDYRS